MRHFVEGEARLRGRGLLQLRGDHVEKHLLQLWFTEQPAVNLDKVNQLKCSRWRRQGLVVRAEAMWEKI